MVPVQRSGAPRAGPGGGSAHLGRRGLIDAERRGSRHGLVSVGVAVSHVAALA